MLQKTKPCIKSRGVKTFEKLCIKSQGVKTFEFEDRGKFNLISLLENT